MPARATRARHPSTRSARLSNSAPNSIVAERGERPDRRSRLDAWAKLPHTVSGALVGWLGSHARELRCYRASGEGTAGGHGLRPRARKPGVRLSALFSSDQKIKTNKNKRSANREDKILARSCMNLYSWRRPRRQILFTQRDRFKHRSTGLCFRHRGMQAPLREPTVATEQW